MNHWIALLTFGATAIASACVEYNPEDRTEPVPYGENVIGPLPIDPPVVDTWSWPRVPVDLLFIVDTSCSMLDDQDRLLSNIPRLVEPLVAHQYDYHLGAITMDCAPIVTEDGSEIIPWCGLLHTYLTPENVVDPARLLVDAQALLGMGIGGSGRETGLLALYQALLLQDLSGGFFRSHVPLHVVLISDEPDQSYTNGLSVEGLTDALLGKFNDGGLYVNSIVHAVSEFDLACGAMYAPQYIEVSQTYPGVVQDICEEDWSSTMDQIAAAFQGTEFVFPLSHVPDLSTVEVHIVREGVGEVVLSSTTWAYDPAPNAIVITDPVLLELQDVTGAWVVYQAAQ